MRGADGAAHRTRLDRALRDSRFRPMRVTISRASADERLAGGSRSRVPPDGGAML